MSREIKFRVWDAIHNRWLDTNLNAYTYVKFFLPNTTFQQFTGLKDIKGRDIYEGDLVNFHIPGRPHGPEREDFTYEEVWFDENSASFAFGRIYYDGWHGYGTWDVKDLEVVGNIFENSDKVKKIGEAALSAVKQ